MKVFLVMESSGSYDAYIRLVDKVFLNRSDAEQYIEKQNAYWKEQKTLADRCRNCEFYWEDEISDREKFMRDALAVCPDAKFNWEYGTMPCHFDIWEDEVPRYDIDEREVQ